MVSGKDSSNPLMADNLPKIVWYSTHHVVLMKSWLVQKKTALGNDKSNPFIVDSLLKTICEGFNQIIDFLNESSIKYALTVNPNIYVSCIKKIWTTVAVKKVNDVTRLQALVDKKKVVITESIIRDVLCLDDAEGVVESDDDEVHDEGVSAVGVATEGVVSVAEDVVPTADEEPSIPSPTPPSPPPQPSQDGRMIADIDADVDVVLEDAKDVATDIAKDGQVTDVKDNADIQGRTAEFQAQIYQIDLEHANKMLSIQEEEESEPAELQEVVDVVTTAKIITENVTAAGTTITAADVPIPTATTVAAPILTAAPSRRRKLMLYLKNVAGFKMDYFKGMSYDDIRLIFEKHFNFNVNFLLKSKEQIDEEENGALKRLNESKEEKAAKKQKLDEESLVKERFTTTKPKNFSDDFLLITFGAMFKKPDIHAQIWKNQRSVNFQAKVKSWKLLESCEEESKVSLDLLRSQRTHKLIADMDADVDVVLEDAKDVVADIAKDGQVADVLSMQEEEESKPAKLQEVVDIVTTAKIIIEVVTAAGITITAADVPIPAATTVVAPILTAAPSRRRK
nr:hypothetical protein [Tanacetum cinerariifolium]